MAIVLTCFVASGAGLAAQEASLAVENPLAVLHDELKAVLAGADLPFSDEQDRAITLMMEERQRASEDLFGDLMDFRAGPTRGQESDRLRSAIAWMRGEFLSQVENYLSEPQLAVWRRFEESGGLDDGTSAGGTEAPPPAETQLVRINNDPFTAEDEEFRRNGGGTEVIPRGGAGAFHGNAEFLLKDDALNARNAFAGNKPPYQERQLRFDFGGPVIPGRLTAHVFGDQNESKNVDTINATLPTGPFALGITRPQTNRGLGSSGTYQVADAHSLIFNVRYNSSTREDQGIGGFTLPERASDFHGHSWNTQLRQFSALSSRSLYETRVSLNTDGTQVVPATDAVRINVLDAFGSGGSQNRNSDKGRRFNFGNLYTRFGEMLTLKTGFDGAYRIERSEAFGNFGGTFTFSSLDDYVAGRPISYRVNAGDPVLETRQLEVSAFVQTDVRFSSQLTVTLGARYDAQTNLNDRNNLAPRAGFAYALGRATVIRGGGGLYYSRLNVGLVDSMRRFDGARQFEIIVDNPTYPNPFESGSIRMSFPSLRVFDPRLRAPRIIVGMLSLERTLFNGLFVTATYDYQSETGRLRLRDLNAPYDATSPVPRSCTPMQSEATCVRPDPESGNVLNLESTGNEVRHNFRVNVRQRFSIFNVSANYSFQHVLADTAPNNASDLPTDNYYLRGDWGRAPFPAHNLSGTVNARLPLGVFLTGAVSINSGRYYTITTGLDDNRDTNITDRPAGVPRNSEVGPKYVNFDANVSKAFFLGRGGRNINVFANMTNAFNRVHLGTPSGVLSSSNFGRSTSAQNPREIEAGLRFQF
jgi:hypothetical protein